MQSGGFLSDTTNTIINVEKQIQAHTISTFTEFLVFLKNKDVLHLMIATILATNMNTISQTLVDSLISPIINLFISNDQETQLADFKITIRGVDFGIGQIISLLFRVFLILYFSYIFIIYVPHYASQLIK